MTSLAYCQLSYRESYVPHQPSVTSISSTGSPPNRFVSNRQAPTLVQGSVVMLHPLAYQLSYRESYVPHQPSVTSISSTGSPPNRFVSNQQAPTLVQGSVVMLHPLAYQLSYRESYVPHQPSVTSISSTGSPPNRFVSNQQAPTLSKRDPKGVPLARCARFLHGLAHIFGSSPSLSTGVLRFL
jgi:hypothetical protein